MTTNSEIVCPTTGEVCPAKQQLHDLYVGNAEDPLAFDDIVPRARTYEMGLRDQTLYAARMAEYSLAATVKPCGGETATGECPTRVGMDQSPVRRGLVDTVRSILRRQPV